MGASKKAEEIAGKLSEAQRRAVEDARQSRLDGKYHPLVATSRKVLAALCDRGIVKNRPTFPFTPLGLKIRRILEKNMQS